MRLSLLFSQSNLRKLVLPLSFTFGLPLLSVVLILALAVLAADAMIFVATLPIIPLFAAYIYFPWALTRKEIFTNHNTAKSIVLGIGAFEVYRQILTFLFAQGGLSLTALIRQQCGPEVDTLQEALRCGAAFALTFTGINLFLLLLPAALLELLPNGSAKSVASGRVA